MSARSREGASSAVRRGPKRLGEHTIRGEADQVLLRSRLRAVSRRMGFHDVVRERMELVCNEMVTNQIKHAGGRGLVQIWEIADPAPALDLFALDFGPGLADLSAARKDGYTTAGTMGKGLGAIGRLAHVAELYSVPEGLMPAPLWHGMAVWARFYAQSQAEEAIQTGAYLRAYQDAVHNGDAICARGGARRRRWLHLDGLGHGREAAQASAGIEELLDEEASLTRMMETLSRRLRGGRGAVAILAEADVGAQRAVLVGAGDMEAYLILNGQRHSISFPPGILGHAHRHLEEQVYEFPPQAVIITASDGIRHTWTLNSFPGLWRLHPQLIALILGNTLGRSSDDQSVFVVRATPKNGDK
jgi:anti-sigma regulatory factor (Ser/Thr protein kinase)